MTRENFSISERHIRSTSAAIEQKEVRVVSSIESPRLADQREDDLLKRGFVLMLRAEGKSPMTVRRYELSVRQYQEFARKMGFPTQVTREHVTHYLSVRTGARAGNTARNDYMALVRYFRYLREEGETTTMPLEHVRPAFRVVQGHRADQGQLQVGYLFLCQLVSGDHAERVFPGVEAGHLRDERPVETDANPIEYLAGCAIGERKILGAQRVDRRWNDVNAADGKVRRNELVHREDRRIVIRQELTAEAPDRCVRLTGVNVTAPDPAGVIPAVKGKKRSRLWVMDKHDVVFFGQRRRVGLGCCPIVFLLLGAQAQVRALQAVVDLLRYLKEGVIAADDLPVGDEPQVVVQRNR